MCALKMSVDGTTPSDHGSGPTSLAGAGPLIFNVMHLREAKWLRSTGLTTSLQSAR